MTEKKSLHDAMLGTNTVVPEAQISAEFDQQALAAQTQQMGQIGREAQVEPRRDVGTLFPKSLTDELVDRAVEKYSAEHPSEPSHG